ncbi:MAG: uracil permease [Clostridiales bacterium]|jgi:uracil permease|nr:uracil permease [Clostridiales bacterium]
MNAENRTFAIDTARTIAVPESQVAFAKNMAWIVSLVTLISTILFSVYLKGFMGQIPLILGPIVGCIAAFIIKLATGIDLFKVLPETANTEIFALPIWFGYLY